MLNKEVEQDDDSKRVIPASTVAARPATPFLG